MQDRTTLALGRADDARRRDPACGTTRRRPQRLVPRCTLAPGHGRNQAGESTRQTRAGRSAVIRQPHSSSRRLISGEGRPHPGSPDHLPFKTLSVAAHSLSPRFAEAIHCMPLACQVRHASGCPPAGPCGEERVHDTRTSPHLTHYHQAIEACPAEEPSWNWSV